MHKHNFQGYATGADYLVAQGVNFNPDTVILTVHPDAYWDMEYSKSIEMRCRPIFMNQIIEQIVTVEDVPLLRAIYVTFEPDDNTALMTNFNANDRAWIAGQTAGIQLSPEGYIEQDEIHVTDNIYTPLNTQPVMNKAQIIEDVVFALAVFATIHDGYEIEEVKLPRQYRRRIERKTGKKPSNHYHLRHIKNTRKRYQLTGSSSDSKRPQHLVRGHFRHVENHPIQHFNGDYWIPSHIRGGDKSTQKSKPVYRIEL
ncbi:MAG: hypothetical protein AAFN11_00145 [Chloroflexota bacterium]